MFSAGAGSIKSVVSYTGIPFFSTVQYSGILLGVGKGGAGGIAYASDASQIWP
jgi:hypothetical protein